MKMEVEVLQPECLNNGAALLLFSLGQASVESGFPISAEAKVSRQWTHKSHNALMRLWWMDGCTEAIDEEWHIAFGATGWKAASFQWPLRVNKTYIINIIQS